METAIIVALISFVGSVTVCLINNHFNTKSIESTHAAQLEDLARTQNAKLEDMIAHNEESIAVMETIIDNLRSEVEKHNQIVERVFILEGKAEKFTTVVKLIADDVKDSKRAIERLTNK